MSTGQEQPSPALGGTVARLVARSRFEVLPLAGIEERVLEHVPAGVTLTVTASPTRGLGPTLALTERLAAHGYRVVPHLAARLVRDAKHLSELVDWAREARIVDVFVVAGDATEPEGAYDGALPLLRDLAEREHPFREIGIAGYPEGHPLIDDRTVEAVLHAKAAHATYVTTQVCFDPLVTARWVEGARARGIGLPILVGIPGEVSRTKLLRISSRIGIGDSLRFLRKHGSFANRFVRGGFSPDPLIAGLGGLLDDGQIAGFHVFTFNEVETTEAWRRRVSAAG